MNLTVARMASPVTSLGPGQRVVLWVQGCTLACAGCASIDTWDPAGGTSVRTTDLADQLATRFADESSLTGLTVTGGEPLQQAGALADLLHRLRQLTRGLNRSVDVLLFTGFELAAARRRAGPALWGSRAATSHETTVEREALVDAVVAGRYRAEAGYGGPLRGSANQQLVPLTPLGRARYSDLSDADPSIQVTMTGRELQLVGIPRPGDLPRLQARLAARGVRFGSVSWLT